MITQLKSFAFGYVLYIFTLPGVPNGYEAISLVKLWIFTPRAKQEPEAQMSPDCWSAQENWILGCLKSMCRHTWKRQKLKRSNEKALKLLGFFVTRPQLEVMSQTVQHA